eukprot:CAMPEP_0206222722 /NCGR_PEP_ID=MMETSP0047_2-20121206/6106_1 /ASSEMBLY_ACC=CAM_ASM_000192 /TAXON_ID=195065 /ORGANISM="Chroomonas mesostigmatica_cf, Strain CCMP1168" /LENGTH=109 /DNA_ID=CAMNT_0053645555 /DNA_START=111 /DNA_END=440 /DNA_ORIENTATION=+
MKLARTMATLARGIPETGTFHFAKFENGILRMGVMGLLGASAAGIYAANQEATPVAKKSPADIPGPWTGGFRAKMSQSIPPLFFTPELKQIPSMSAVRPYLEGPVLLGA